MAIQGQKLVIHLNDGSIKENEVSSLSYIGFAGVMNDTVAIYTDLYFKSGARQRIKSSTIDYMEFVKEIVVTPDSCFNEWPGYSPTLSYNFKENYPNFAMPTQDLPYDGGNLKKKVSDGWWTVFVGNNANSTLTDTGIANLLKRLNTDFAFLRDSMGWPPDLAPQKGYRSAVFVYGSGLSTDDASNTDLGGWQSWITLNGTTYPMILISYYPIYCYDPACPYSDVAYQTRAVVHEGIHTVLSSMRGGRNAAWINESCNCWLQNTMELAQGKLKYSTFEFGWLAGGTVVAPFIPIESYGGWLTDGSFGGPNYEGLNNNTRSLVGAVQYSELFPTFLGEYLGNYSLPWIWQNCTTTILEGMAKKMGSSQMRRLIQEYRARLCLSDMGPYENALLKMYRDYMGYSVNPEHGESIDSWKATPYAKTTVDTAGYLIPDELTLPGWTGANIIPIKVGSSAKTVTVTFDPMTTKNTMSCQLCYRTATGKTVYGLPVNSGDFTLSLDGGRPASDVVFAVVCNLNYSYTSSIRTNKYKYRLKLGNGATGTANVYGNWYRWK